METRSALSVVDRGEPHRLAVLDSIRGMAALIVVVHHCLLTTPAFSDFFFSNWKTSASTLGEYVMFHTPARLVWGGYEAVTLFYVLSGLVLALPWVERRPPDYAGFAIKRVCRIYLPYAVAMAIAALLSYALTMKAPIPGMSQWVNEMNWSHPVTPLAIADHVFMLGHRNNINGPIHSLIWEMRVSLLFPLMMLPLVRWRLRGVAILAAALAVFIAVLQSTFGNGGLTWPLTLPTEVQSITDKFVMEVMWTAYYAYFFVFGSTIALCLKPIRNAWARAPRWMSGICMIGALLIIQGHWTHDAVIQEMCVAAGSVLLIGSSLAPGAIQTILSTRLLRWFGEISYGLYLTHVPLLLAAVILLHGRMPLPVLLCGVAVTSVFLGWVFHVLVVKPCTQLGRRLSDFFPRERHLAPAERAVMAPSANLSRAAAPD